MKQDEISNGYFSFASGAVLLCTEMCQTGDGDNKLVKHTRFAVHSKPISILQL